MHFDIRLVRVTEDNRVYVLKLFQHVGKKSIHPGLGAQQKSPALEYIALPRPVAVNDADRTISKFQPLGFLQVFSHFRPVAIAVNGIRLGDRLQLLQDLQVTDVPGVQDDVHPAKNFQDARRKLVYKFWDVRVGKDANFHQNPAFSGCWSLFDAQPNV